VRALFVGRFQPLHWGHVKVIEWLLSSHDVIVAIGSADKALTFENPFTAGERHEMFLRYFNGEIKICTVPDTNGRASLWGAYLRHWCPRFDVVYSNNVYVRTSLMYSGIETRRHPMFEAEVYSGTSIRKLMAEKNPSWRGLVPSSVAEYIDEIGGIDRISSLARVERRY